MYDDLISRMYIGLQETLEEVEQLPVSEQVRHYVVLLQASVDAVFALVLDGKGYACNTLPLRSYVISSA